MESCDDFALLAAWREGDASAGQTLARRHYKTLRRFLGGKVDDDAARDVAQAVFLTLCERRHDFAGHSSFKTFLIGIARFKLIEFYRARAGGRFDPVQHSFVDAKVDESITSLFGRRQHEHIVVQALRSLSVDDQILLELKAHEKMTARELAEVFGVEQPTLSGRINRARERLRTAVSKLSSMPELRTPTPRQLEDWIDSVRVRISGAATPG